MVKLKHSYVKNKLLVVILWLFDFSCQTIAQIAMSSDLNCKFASHCRWQNATTSIGRWLLTDYVDITEYYTIKPMSERKDDFFAYTSSKNGLPPAELVSDIIGCQLGGGKLKYWYYLTGKTSSLQICLRPPNGAPVGEQQCYNGLSSTRAHQWAYNAVELPPFSKPMEILFRAFYGASDDSIALDDIVYDAILCGNSSSSSIRTRFARFASWSTIPIIDTEKWNSMKLKIERDGKRPPLMLIVAKEENEESVKKNLPEAEDNLEETIEKEENYKKELEKWANENENESTTKIFEATTSTSTTEPTTTTTATQKSTTSTTTTVPTTQETTTQDTILFGHSTTKNPTGDLANFMALFRQVAPILPAIPSIVKSFSPASDLGLPIPARAAGVPTFSASNLPNFPSFGSASPSTENEWKLFGNSIQNPSNTENAVSNLFGNSQTTPNPVYLLLHGTPIKPINAQNRGIYTQSYESNEESTTKLPNKENFAPTVYPPNSFGIKKNLHKISEKKKTTPIPMDLSQLTVNELKQLEAIHRKLFPNKIVSFNQKIPEKTTPYLTRMLPEMNPTLPTVTSPQKEFESYNDENLSAPESPQYQTTRQPSLVVYEKSKSTAPKSLNGVNFGAGSNLTPEMVNELTMLREIPDLEELTEGMDLSLLNRPGGFAHLKQQFIERLIQRSTKKLLNGRKRRTKLQRYTF